jgi:tRNA (mo5U34)-methyltransferase
VESVPTWCHSIDLGDGVVTPGTRTTRHLRERWEAMRLPVLDGKDVLDIGAWDGFFAFEAERHGAAKVVALDHYVWSMDLARWTAVVEEASARGEPVPLPEQVPGLWQPDELPGKRGFDVAHAARSSAVVPVVADFMSADIESLGRFDVVFYLGVLYHMRDAFGALARLARVTRELAVIETEAMQVQGAEHVPLWQFYGGSELANDPTNWWVPNEAALVSACKAAGFSRVEVHSDPPRRPAASAEPAHYRLLAHAMV